MSTITGTVSGTSPDQIEVDFLRELAEIEAESLGWIALDEQYYLHAGSNHPVIEVVGQVSAGMAGSNLLWLY